MIFNIQKTCPDYSSFKSEKIKAMFNVDSGSNFEIQAEIPTEDKDWQIGVIVGASGSGKSSIGAKIAPFYNPIWDLNKPIIDAVSENVSFDDANRALNAVGLSSVPSWLRPYNVLSTGEKFRADLAKLILEAPELAVVDEFSSVVDRQVAQISAGAFAKAWRRLDNKQVVLLSCHYDILDWLNPDWVFDTSTNQLERGLHRQRQKIELKINQCNKNVYSIFEKHHYLKLNNPIAPTYYVATVQGEPVAHICTSPRPGCIEMGASRLATMPDWQGLGIGFLLLNEVAKLNWQGINRFNKPMRTVFNTAHPLLANKTRNHKDWTQISGNLYGSKESKSKSLKGKRGGHWRALQGFRFIGK